MNKTVKLLLYCTVAKPYLARNVFSCNEKNYGLYSFKLIQYEKDISLNGKIVAEAECDLVEYIYRYNCGDVYKTTRLTEDKLLDKSCLDYGKLLNYIGEDKGYAIHLKNVKPFKEPKELSDYGIKKAPQNMCYLYDKDGKIIAVVISIQAPHMCNIMNDLKTIEVRTQILNIFKELIR